MKDDPKPQIKALEFCIYALKQVQKAKDVHERLAAVELEVELTARVDRLREADRNPELPLPTGESAHELVGAHGGRH